MVSPPLVAGKTSHLPDRFPIQVKYWRLTHYQVQDVLRKKQKVAYILSTKHKLNFKVLYPFYSSIKIDRLKKIVIDHKFYLQLFLNLKNWILAEAEAVFI